MFEEDPFANFGAPEWLRPFSDTIYYLPEQTGKALKKDMEQAVYFYASFLAIFCSFVLKGIREEKNKRIFSIVTGMTINFFVFGITALVPLI